MSIKIRNPFLDISNRFFLALSYLTGTFFTLRLAQITSAFFLIAGGTFVFFYGDPANPEKSQKKQPICFMGTARKPQWENELKIPCRRSDWAKRGLSLSPSCHNLAVVTHRVTHFHSAAQFTQHYAGLMVQADCFRDEFNCVWTSLDLYAKLERCSSDVLKRDVSPLHSTHQRSYFKVKTNINLSNNIISTLILQDWGALNRQEYIKESFQKAAHFSPNSSGNRGNSALQEVNLGQTVNIILFLYL